MSTLGSEPWVATWTPRAAKESAMPDAGSGRERPRYSFETRCRAVRLMLGGMSAAAAAAASVGADPSSAYRWLARYRADGGAGLRERSPARPWRRLLVEAIARYGTERGYPPSFRDLVTAHRTRFVDFGGVVLAGGVRARGPARARAGTGARPRADGGGTGARRLAPGARAGGHGRCASRAGGIGEPRCGRSRRAGQVRPAYEPSGSAGGAGERAARRRSRSSSLGSRNASNASVAWRHWPSATCDAICW